MRILPGNTSPFVIFWLITIAISLGYYLIKTLILGYTTNAVDAVVICYGLVSLVVYLYFFNNKKKNNEDES